MTNKILREFVCFSLTEGRFEWESTVISREIIKSLVSSAKKTGGFKEVELKFNAPKNLNISEITVKVLFDNNLSPTKIKANGSFYIETKQLELVINLNPKWKKFEFAKNYLQKFVTVIKTVLRHEIEHSNQKISDISYSEFDETAEDILEYYLDKSEIEAWVVSIYKRAKMIKRSFFDTMHTILEKQIYSWAMRVGESFYEADEIIEQIEEVWKEYAYRRFPDAF